MKTTNYKLKLPRKLKKEVRKISRIANPPLGNYILSVNDSCVKCKCEWYEGYVIKGKKNKYTIKLINKLTYEAKRQRLLMYKNELDRPDSAMMQNYERILNNYQYENN